MLQNLGGSAGSPTHSGYWGSNGNLIQQNLNTQALQAQQQALSMLQSSSELDRQVGCLEASFGPACLSQALLQHHSLCTQVPSGTGYKLQRLCWPALALLQQNHTNSSAMMFRTLKSTF